jgi:hypothetical protein
VGALSGVWGVLMDFYRLGFSRRDFVQVLLLACPKYLWKQVSYYPAD